MARLPQNLTQNKKDLNYATTKMICIHKYKFFKNNTSHLKWKYYQKYAEILRKMQE